MSWFFTDAGIGAVASIGLALVAVVVTLLLAARDRRDRQLVEIDPTRSRVHFQAGNGQPHRAEISILSTGNRATVIRDIRLVGDKGDTFRNYRLAGGCVPVLPFRVDAPDEKVAVLELTDDEEKRLHHIEVDFLGGTKPIQWPYDGAAAVTGVGSISTTGFKTLLPGDAVTAGQRDTTVSSDSNSADVLGPLREQAHDELGRAPPPAPKPTPNP